MNISLAIRLVYVCLQAQQAPVGVLGQLKLEPHFWALVKLWGIGKDVRGFELAVSCSLYLDTLRILPFL